MTLSWLGLVQEIAGPLRHRLLPQCPPDGEYRDDLICRKDAHTSSSPAAQDAMGGRTGLLPRPLPKVPSGRERELVAEETRALAPAPSGSGEGKPLGAWLPLAKVNQAAPYSGALRAPGRGPSPGECAVPGRAFPAPPGRCSNPTRAGNWCPGRGQSPAAGADLGAARAERVPPRDVLC